MSVINQMLKDLDERQSEQQHSQTSQILQKKPVSPWKLITLIVIVVIALNIAGVFIWQLYVENKSLKSNHENSYEKNQQAQQLIKGLENKLLTAKSVESNNAADTELLSSETPEAASINNVTSQQAEENTLLLQKVKTQEKYFEADDSIKHNETNNTEVLNDSPIESVSQERSEKEGNNLLESETQVKEIVKPTLSISRKQLTAAELTQQKIGQAEQALAENELTKAEKLFEDVLLMTPEHKSARKQLAALWFGRQSFQAAINVLSQGIQLYPDDSEFRLMKARIYLNQGQTVAAVNTLKDLPYVENVEYQALLASHAQQISQFGIATTAYQLLAKLEPNAGRWWLGLAVAYDSNSEFDQAVIAYGQSIDKSDLSENARQFARQRIQELGE